GAGVGERRRGRGGRVVRAAGGGAGSRARGRADARDRAHEAALRRGGDRVARGAARGGGGGAGRGGADAGLPRRRCRVRREARASLQRELRRECTSPSSGQRPSLCFEKTSSPSAITSYWLFTPSRAVASNPCPRSSAARLAARSS